METSEGPESEECISTAATPWGVPGDPRGPAASNPADCCFGAGFRERLIAAMDAAKVPKSGRLAHLSALTGRVPQTSRRWIDPVKPGLPDLESFALLCRGFRSDANWFLGLDAAEQEPAHEGACDSFREPGKAGNSPSAAWIAPMVQELVEGATACAPMKMAGDDMEPIVHDGDTVLVDFGARDVDGNGIYLVECDGRVMLRNVESRIGEGLVLSCANTKYKATVVKNAAAVQRLGLKVLGKARGAIRILQFCRMN